MGLRRVTLFASFIVVALTSAAAQPAVTTTVVDVPTRGVNQRFLYVRPDNPVATIVEWPGGDGVLGIQADGSMTGGQTASCNPVVRNRSALAARGYAIAAIDAASDGALWNYDDAVEVIRYVRSRDNVPVWMMGASNSTGPTVGLVATLPLDTPMGAIFHPPEFFSTSQAASIKRPTGIVYNPLDSSQRASQLYIALTSAPVRQLIGVTGGSNNGCGYHLFQGLDSQFVAAVGGFIDQYNSTLAAEPPVVRNYQGLWWNSPAGSESGWGINFAHQGDVIFATWFTYDATGRDLWLSMTASKTAENVYSGTLAQTHGPAFSAVPFNPGGVTAAAVGMGTLTFSDSSNGTFAYVVNGVAQTKSITRQVFGTLPACVFGAQPNLALATNYQDLWYAAPAESEAGWGANFTHQGDTIFATWFTYDNDGAPLWLSVTATRSGPGVYSGPLVRTRGPAFSAVPFLPASVTPMAVGTLTITFANGNTGTFAYTVNGVTQSKAITRQVFRTPGTVCQ